MYSYVKNKQFKPLVRSFDPIEFSVQINTSGVNLNK